MPEMNYCMQCGTRLHLRHHETEGEVPYCDTCGEFRYPVFNTAVSMLVMNEAKDRIILIQQYGNGVTFWSPAMSTRGRTPSRPPRAKSLRSSGWM